MNRTLKAMICRRTPLLEGFLRVYRYDTELERHQGAVRRLSWHVMERGNSVAVLGHDPKRDEIVLANEFRAGPLAAGDYPYQDNLVAVTTEDGETALNAAVRETKEEAGLVLSDPVLIQSGAYVSPVAHLRRFHSYTAGSTHTARPAFMEMLQRMTTS